MALLPTILQVTARQHGAWERARGRPRACRKLIPRLDAVGGGRGFLDRCGGRLAGEVVVPLPGRPSIGLGRPAASVRAAPGAHKPHLCPVGPCRLQSCSPAEAGASSRCSKGAGITQSSTGPTAGPALLLSACTPSGGSRQAAARRLLCACFHTPVSPRPSAAAHHHGRHRRLPAVLRGAGCDGPGNPVLRMRMCVGGCCGAARGQRRWQAVCPTCSACMQGQHCWQGHGRAASHPPGDCWHAQPGPHASTAPCPLPSARRRARRPDVPVVLPPHPGGGGQGQPGGALPQLPSRVRRGEDPDAAHRCRAVSAGRPRGRGVSSGAQPRPWRRLPSRGAGGAARGQRGGCRCRLRLRVTGLCCWPAAGWSRRSASSRRRTSRARRAAAAASTGPAWR